MNRTYRFLRHKSDEIPLLEPREIDLDGGYYGRGYGYATEEGDAAMDIFGKREIILESTYTAKAAAATLQSCRSNPDETILYWHTFNSVDLDAELSSSEFETLPKELKVIVQ
jgi:1-aminocyclopropane-1-carboxylate deaminase/D-cysteine desulfhydrase-like pyridoxal-dependent ACC family enzyme